MKGIEYFLLVDDNKPTNFFNKTIIQKSGCVGEVLIAENGQEALDILNSGIVPEVILLDLNMPVMDGWEFLDAFHDLGEKYAKSVIILMLGTSLGSDDKEKAERIFEIREYSEKILTKEKVQNIIRKYFPEEFEHCQKIQQLSINEV